MKEDIFGLPIAGDSQLKKDIMKNKQLQAFHMLKGEGKLDQYAASHGFAKTKANLTSFTRFIVGSTEEF